MLFSSTKQGHRQARAQCQVVGSSPENDWLANVVIHATNGLKSSEDTAAKGIELLAEIAFFRNVPTDVPLLPPLLAASSRLPLGRLD